jgi:putative holliday junction resolvase
MRAMGLDVGTKTVGVALGDELGITAQALTTIRRKNLKEDLSQLASLIEEHEVSVLVVGLPLNMDGSEGLKAQECRAFGAALQEKTELPIEYWDERLSTVAAQRVLLEADLSREKRRKVIDQVAAAVILQGWLDARQTHSNDSEEP